MTTWLGAVGVFMLVIAIMALAFYFFTSLAWLISRKKGWSRVAVQSRKKPNANQSFLISRARCENSVFSTLDCFWRCYVGEDGIVLRPWLPVPLRSIVSISWDALGSERSSNGYYSSVPVVLNRQCLVILFSEKQLETLDRSSRMKSQALYKSEQAAASKTNSRA